MELTTEQVVDSAAYRSLEFVRGLQGFSDTTSTVWVSGDCWPPYQEIVTRYPLCGASKLFTSVHCVEGQSTLSFGLIVPDNRRHYLFGRQNGKHLPLTGKLWAWNSKSRQIFCKQFDSRNSYGAAVQIVYHDCDITNGSILSVYRDPKTKNIHFIINGKEGTVSISGNGPDFCYGYARLCCEGCDSRIQVTLIPERDEAYFGQNPSSVELPDVNENSEACLMPMLKGLWRLLPDLPRRERQVHQNVEGSTPASLQDVPSIIPEVRELSYYKTNNKNPRGICLVINNVANLTLKEKQLADLFRALAFDVQVKRNLRMIEIYEVTRQFAEKDHSGYDTFVFIVMSVCSHDHEIAGLDRRNASVEQVMSEFKASKCPSLQNKPKLFFVMRYTMSPSKFVESHDSSLLEPYCTDAVELTSISSPSASAGTEICPEEADFLLTCVISAVDEAQQVLESSFSQVLATVVRKYCHLYHLLEMLTKVNDLLVKKQTGQPNRVPLVQVPYLTHTLRYKVRLGLTPASLQDAASVIPETLPLSSYEIRNRNCQGYCVIINNLRFRDKNMADRTGAREDEKSLKYLFSALKFNVVTKNDLNKHEIEEVAEKFGRKDHREFGAFVFILMSHGGDRDCILGVDGRKTTVENLMVEFQARKCPSLTGKPKVFIIQTCRGLLDNLSEVFTTPIGSINTQAVLSTSPQADTQSCVCPFSPDSTLPRSVFPTEADFLLAFATVPGYVSFRLLESGTFFIQALVEVIKEHHHRHHLLDILTEVTKRVVDRQNMQPNMGHPVQVPAPMHTLTKHLYL